MPSRMSDERFAEIDTVATRLAEEENAAGFAVWAGMLCELLAEAKRAREAEATTIAESPELLDVGRAAIEEFLVMMRDSRMSDPQRGNGFVIRERDGRDSAIIRLGTADGIKRALKAIAEHLAQSLPTSRPSA